jgi:NADH-quinone oxidoreductase subunit H
LNGIIAGNALFRNIYSFFAGLLPDSLAWLAFLITGVVIVFVLINVLLATVAMTVYAERRVLGRFQARLGPNRVGPFGLLQPIADLLKLIFKEDVIPAQADKLVFTLGPVVMAVPVLALTGVIPFGKNTYITNINVGVLYAVSITSLSTLGIFMAGWGSSNRFSTLGAMRGVAQLISYEVPMVLSLAGVLLLTGSLSLVDVVEAQRIPYFLLQPLGFVVFFIAASAEMNRTPFDIVEADSELVSGYHTEYSGAKWGLFQLAEYATMIASSAIMVTIFLRGWQNPFMPLDWHQWLPSQLWFVLKLALVVFLLIWVRATWPRLRIDQILGFAWKVLFPLAVINLVMTAVLVNIWPEPSAAQLWAMVVVNMAVAVGAVIAFGATLGRKQQRPRDSVRYVSVNAEVGA